MAAVVKSKRIPEDVLAVLSGMSFDGNAATIGSGQLDRKLYLRVNEVLEALGGKWHRQSKTHRFDCDAVERVEEAILTGEFTRPGDLGWFPTPPAVVAQMIELSELEPGMSVLEPSAGEGAIVTGVRTYCTTKITCVEIDERRAASIGDADLRTIGDFLKLKPEDWLPFDRVVMNPPFAPRQSDIEHVCHAFKFLKPGGILVSVMSAGVTFRQNSNAVVFRQMVEECGDEIIPLPENSFKASGTGVNAVIVKMRKA